MSELKATTPKALVMTGRHNEPIYIKSEADEVIEDKDAEIRRLKRALYKVCANWAHFAVAFFSSYATKEKWRKMENKCRAKAKELEGK